MVWVIAAAGVIMGLCLGKGVFCSSFAGCSFMDMKAEDIV